MPVLNDAGVRRVVAGQDGDQEVVGVALFAQHDEPGRVDAADVLAGRPDPHRLGEPDPDALDELGAHEGAAAHGGDEGLGLDSVERLLVEDDDADADHRRSAAASLCSPIAVTFIGSCAACPSKARVAGGTVVIW